MTATTGTQTWAGLDDLPDAAVVVDAGGSIRYANAAAGRLVGAGAAELVGRDAATRLPMVDASGRDWWACADPLATDPTVVARIPETEVTLSAAGRARPVALTAARWSRGADTGFVLSLRRVEGRRRRDARHAELVSALSHDLRSPLTTVKGFAKTLLVRDDRLTPEQRREMLAAVVADADRLNRLVGEVVDALRLDAGRLELRPARTDPGALIERALAGLPGERRARVRATVPDQRPPLLVDVERVGAALATMLLTALDGEGEVSLAATTGPSGVQVRVRAPDAKPPAPATRLFGRAVPGDRDAIRRWVARGVAEAHGGRIAGADLPDGGLELTLTLPSDLPRTS